MTTNTNSAQYEVHEHHFVSGPRSHGGYDNQGNWQTGKFSHSHLGGEVPHAHPHTGPSFYGYRKPKMTKKPNGEQMPYVVLSEEETSFELVITDSALLHGETPIGDTPLEDIHMPAADRMVMRNRLKCIVRDERTKRAS